MTAKTPPTDDDVRLLCRIGEGAATCRYLTRSPVGWSCEKHGEFHKLLDQRVMLKMMNARGDNCEGKGAQ